MQFDEPAASIDAADARAVDRVPCADPTAFDHAPPHISANEPDVSRRCRIARQGLGHFCDIFRR
jgi:hypothetical protein